jgi:hypothetical protein
MTIDFPNSSTTKNSKNYVKKMKRLEVNIFGRALVVASVKLIAETNALSSP